MESRAPSHSDTITVGGNSISTRVEHALTTSDLIDPKKIVELDLSFNRNFGASFFYGRKGTSIVWCFG